MTVAASSVARRGRLIAMLGLGLAIGAAFPARLSRAQHPPVRDSAIVPSPTSRLPDSAALAAQDTAAKAADTLKTPLAVAPLPTERSVGPAYAWDRDALFASGAHTLLDLLEQVPGVTALRVGWLLPPEMASYDGSFGRIRIFLDGVELAALIPRAGGLFELSRIDLWPLEYVMVERGAGELRVHLRSWSVQSTSTDTRTDVATGQYRTNLFRGFFGRRLNHGEAVQFGFQQFSTGDPQGGGDGDQLSLMGRAGWAAGDWSFDAFGLRRRRSVTELRRLGDLTSIPSLDDVQQFGYLRVGYRDPAAAGFWAQAVASSDGFRQRLEGGTIAPPSDSTPAPGDTTRSQAQYVVTAGWNRGPARLSATARMSNRDGESFLSPVVRGEVDSRWASVAAYAERRADDSTTRAEMTAEFRPLTWVNAVAAIGVSRPDGEEDPRPTTTSARGEVGVRLGRAWLLGGILRSGDVISGAPVMFDPDFQGFTTGSATGIYGGVRGPVWRDLAADVVVTTWTGGSGALYRPERQARAALTLDTQWLSRFPTGQFGLRATGALAYRSAVLFPVSPEASLQTEGSTVVSAQLEIRIQQAVAFFESRNTMASQYELLPGFLMPRNVLIYGVRWQFWN